MLQQQKKWGRVFWCVLIVLIGGLLFGKQDAHASESDAVQILFVGNSLTYRNQMSQMFQQLAEAGEYEVNVEILCRSGRSLEQWADKSSSLGKRFVKKLRSRQWDYVILQEQSLKPLKNPGSMQKAAASLCRSVRHRGAQPILYMTWAHKEGAAFYSTSFAVKKKLNQQKAQESIARVYCRVGEVNGAAVANVGLAFLRCQQHYNSMELYSSDKRHPSREGSYLAACTLYATIFQEKVPRENCGLSSKSASCLRNMAEKVTFTSKGKRQLGK